MTAEIIKVATLGLAGKERKLVSDVLGATEVGSTRYEMITSGQDVRAASIVLFDSTNKHAGVIWNRLREWAPEGAVTGVSVVDTEACLSGAQFALRRPLSEALIKIMLGKVRILRQSTGSTIEARSDEKRLISIRPNSGGDFTRSGGLPHLSGDILVIDDSITVRKHLSFALARFGLNVDVADDGAAGLKQLVSKKYDLVFLDVVMPGCDGFEICKKIKACVEFRELPIVMLTSKDSVFDKIRGTLSGCDTYLTKPVELGKLQSTLVSYLRKPNEFYAKTVFIQQPASTS